jgi:hypothetical protein
VERTQPGLVVRAVRGMVDGIRDGHVVDCRGGSVFCRARVGFGGGASQRKIVIRLTGDDLRLDSVRPNMSELVGTYQLRRGRRRRGRPEYVTELSAPQAIPPRARLIFTFRAPTD